MTGKSTTTRTIKVDALARVEGEGAITITFKGRVPLSAQLRIFEPPRFFEGFLQGRAITEVPDFTALAGLPGDCCVNSAVPIPSSRICCLSLSI